MSHEYTLAEMYEGAMTAVQTCMAVQPGERVLILGDEASTLLSQAIANAAMSVGATVEWHKLEEYGERPMVTAPAELMALVERFQPQVSFYTAGSRPGELKFRQQYRPAVLQRGARHGHMINITAELMTQGMRVDYNEIHRVTMKVYEWVKSAHEIHVTNPKGTDLVATFHPDRRWVPCHGLYHQAGMWGNLPEGEVYTSPWTCDGLLAADVLGDYFSEKYGVLDSPVMFTIKEGRVVEIFCEDKAIETDVRGYIFGAENSDRVGEFAIGTNIALAGLVGNLLQDEKLPGVHVAFGDPYASTTGADWTSPHHMDVIPTYCTITVDGAVIMVEGNFVPDLLAGE